uniref:Uncharacterized protein n=1 Tax=Physcomitrium patens TaxID=3218 RepID=A9RSZ5_PHYPA|nr:hypothetical protein PHYPA_021622 [Physcomitrium patens]
METAVQTPVSVPIVTPSLTPHRVQRGDSPLSSLGPEENLPTVDETQPCLPRLDVDAGRKKEDNAEEANLENSPQLSSPHEKKGMRDRLRGLADKYVSCLHAIDGGTGDLRGCGGTGSPTVVPAPQPFEAPSVG